jgi:hypothetical protein
LGLRSLWKSTCNYFSNVNAGRKCDPAPDVSLTGNVAAMFVGDETVTGDANTGTITNINWGEETWGQSTWGNGNYFDATGYAQAATITLELL